MENKKSEEKLKPKEITKPIDTGTWLIKLAAASGGKIIVALLVDPFKPNIKYLHSCDHKRYDFSLILSDDDDDDEPEQAEKLPKSIKFPYIS